MNNAKLNPSELVNEKIIKHLMKKYKLGDVDASCIYFDVITALDVESHNSTEDNK